MRKRILDDGKEDGVVVEWHYDEIEDKTHIVHRHRDIEPLLEANKAEYNSFSGRYGEFKKVASIDPVTMTMLMNKGIWGNKERMKRWLNDPDNRFFRTTPGKV